VELRAEDLSCYLNNILSVGLWKCLYDHYLANEAYFSDIAVKIFIRFIRVLPTRWRRKPADIEITLLSLYVYDVRFVTKACGKFDFSSELAQHSFCDDRQVDGKAGDDGRVSTEQRDDDQRRHAER